MSYFIWIVAIIIGGSLCYYGHVHFLKQSQLGINELKRKLKDIDK